MDSFHNRKGLHVIDKRHIFLHIPQLLKRTLLFYLFIIKMKGGRKEGKFYARKMSGYICHYISNIASNELIWHSMTHK